MWTGRTKRWTVSLGVCCALLALGACSSDEELTALGGNNGGSFDDVNNQPSGDFDDANNASGGNNDVAPREDIEPPEPSEEQEEEQELACDPGALEPVELFLSADDSNSQASPRVAAALIEAGRIVPWYRVRTYEFLNYYDVSYPVTPEEVVSVNAQARTHQERPEAYTLQFGIQSAPLPGRKPLNLTFVVDRSGSMAGGPMERAREVVAAISENLREGDVVNVVGWSVDAQVLLDGHVVSGPSDAQLQEVMAALSPNGRTNLDQGLSSAYELARQAQSSSNLNRVVLISDGNTNTGQTGMALIRDKADDAEDDSIYMVGVGVGQPHGYDDRLMDSITDAGKGAYLYIDSAQEARRHFGERFMSTMAIAAFDVRVRMVLPPGFTMETFHGEEASTDPEEVEPQHLAPDDAMIFHQTIVTCAPDAVTGQETILIEATYTDAISRDTQTRTLEMTLDELVGAEGEQLARGEAIVAYAETLKEAGKLRDGDVGEAVRRCLAGLETVEGIGQTLEDPVVDEIAGLLRAYCGLVESGDDPVGSCDCDANQDDIASAMGLCNASPQIERNAMPGDDEGQSIRVIERLRDGGPSMSAREGCRMLALSSGAVGEGEVVPGASYGDRQMDDPMPQFNGDERLGGPDGASVYNNTQVTLELVAPADARSFSFDFLFLSAEFPNFINSDYNDTFYAILEAESTHGGAPTNISFDGNGNAIEVDNNYFENDFHPCYEVGTGFDGGDGGSTCWLRTSWPIGGGERFRLTFSVHDEGDAVYSSTILLDNLQFHGFEAIGATDPIN